MSTSELISREVQKRVWWFLCIQDYYLATFKRSYSIVLAHCTTPPPLNCSEVDVRTDFPLDWFTQSTYQRLQLDLTNIARTLFDNVSSLERAGRALPDIFEKVLEADSSMTRLAWDMRYWLQPQSRADSRDLSGNGESREDVIENVRRTMRISFCHKRMAIHRNFFCRSLADKKFHYSHSTCLDSARAILREVLKYHGQPFEVDCWTIPAHIISACNIIMLKNVFAQWLPMDDIANQGAEDQRLMEECLKGLQPLKDRNKIVERGLTMIQRLIDSKYEPEQPYKALGAEEIVCLVHEVENRIRSESQQADMGSMVFDDSLFTFFD
jgi:hypothetical protein